jgi:hypothetical protein
LGCSQLHLAVGRRHGILFFCELDYLFVLAFVMHRWNLTVKWIGFFVSTIMLFYLRDLSETLNLPFLAIFSSPLNFFPHTFIAILLSAYKAQIAHFKSALLAISLLLYVGLCAFEWQFVILQPNPTVFNDWMPGYSRISLVFGIIFLATLFINVERSPGGVIMSGQTTRWPLIADIVFSWECYCHRSNVL